MGVKNTKPTECLQMDLRTLKALRAAEKLAASDVLTPDKVVTYLQMGKCYQSAGLAEKFKTDATAMWAIMNSLEHRGLVRTIRGSGAHKLWEKCEPKEIVLTTPTITKMRYFGEYYAF